MLTCILFIGASMAEVTAIWYYMLYVDRGETEKIDKRRIRIADNVAAIIYAILFVVFVVAYFLITIDWKGWRGLEANMIDVNCTCTLVE